MHSFNILDLGDYKFRCVLGQQYYFDFTITQFEMFGYNSFFSDLKACEGHDIFCLDKNVIGEVVSIRYNRYTSSAWILIRNGVRGALYMKVLGE